MANPFQDITLKSQPTKDNMKSEGNWDFSGNKLNIIRKWLGTLWAAL